MTTHVVTKTVQILASQGDVFAFVSNVATMPQWAIHNVISVKPRADGSWEMQTPRGQGRLVPHYDERYGILDHEFIDAGEGHWSVPARVVSVGANEAVYIITLAQPPGLPDEAFTQGMLLMDEELRALKECVEGKR